MSPAVQLWTLVLAAGALAGASLLGAGLWLLGSVEDPAQRAQLLAAGGLVAAGEAVALALLGIALRQGTLRPLETLAHFARAATDGTDRPSLPRGRLLGALPGAVDALADALDQARATLRHQRADDAAAQRARLEAVLRQLDQGVIVCDRQTRILMYNPAARRVLRQAVGLGLGRPLAELLARAPLEDALATLERRQEQPGSPGAPPATEFLTTSMDDSALLHCRLCLLPDTDGSAPGLVLAFEDVTRHVEDLVRHERGLRNAVEALRSPLANLRAAAENLAATENPAQRRAFESVLLEDGHTLAERFRRLAAESQRFVPTPWATADVHPEDLVANLMARWPEPAPPEVTVVGQPGWLHADAHALGQLLEHLIRRLAAETGSREFGIETATSGHGVYLDLVWRGEPVGVTTLETWIGERLLQAVGQLTGRDVLERHGSEIWSERHRRRVDHAVIRIPLPAGRSVRRPASRAGSRPEFLSPCRTPSQASAVSLDTPLEQLGFTVFDTETTGLHPEAGDEIIAIAGVRILRGQRLPEEQFQRLVHPRRPIPAESTRWHGLTDREVADAPPIETVLPEFRRFVGDDVLVAHNADFDMCFLRLKEQAAGVHFDNPVLDTLLLSLHLDNHLEDHTLEAIAGRLGVTVNGRHTALGDAVATAEVFLGLLERAREAGIVTLGQALEASRRTLEARLRSARR